MPKQDLSTDAIQLALPILARAREMLRQRFGIGPGKVQYTQSEMTKQLMKMTSADRNMVAESLGFDEFFKRYGGS